MSRPRASRLGPTSPEIDELLGGGGRNTVEGGGGGRRARLGGGRGGGDGAKARPTGSSRRRGLSDGRILLICGAFSAVMATALFRFADMAAQGGAAPAPAVAEGLLNAERAAVLAKAKVAEPRRAARAAILDRHGAPLARDIVTYELYLDRNGLSYEEDLREAMGALATALPARFESGDALMKKLKPKGTTLLDRPLTAREAQRAHDLGIPGLYLTPRFDRVYYAQEVAAHALGYVSVDGRGQAGVEAALDARLTETPEAPLRLSLDLRIQRATRQALAAAQTRFNALASSAVVLSVESGEVLALVSLPDFDPHALPAPPKTPQEQEQSPLFHRAVAGRYELGSVMKTITWAAALERGVAFMGEAFEPLPALEFGKSKIAWDGGDEGASLPAAFARSLNRVAAELALRVGRARQAAMFEKLGLTRPTPIEVGEATRWREETGYWGDVDTAAAGYGYRVKLSAAHMAAALASLVNGGELVRPTLLARDAASLAAPRPRLVSAETSRRMRELLRLTVTSPRGTGVKADVAGLRVGGKTGTAWKHRPGGGYDPERTRASFAAAFPIERPRLVVVVTLDEPTAMLGERVSRSAKHTAAPATADIIKAIAPLAGVAPDRSAAEIETATIRPDILSFNRVTAIEDAAEASALAAPPSDAGAASTPEALAAPARRRVLERPRPDPAVMGAPTLGGLY